MRTTSRSPRIVLAALLLSVAVVSLPAQRLYGPDDAPVRDLVRLYRLAGAPFPTASFPLSTAWLYDTALELRGDLAGRVGVKQALDAYVAGLRYAPEEVRTGIDIEFRPEAYLETDYLRDSITEKLRREDPALRVRVSGGLHDGPLLHTRVEAIRDYNTDSPSNLAPPSESDPIPYEFHNVYEGYLFVPLGYLSVTLGRQPIALGPAPRASIALAELPYHDALRLTLDLGPIRMHHLVSSVDNKRARTDVDLPPSSTALYDFEQNQIFFNTHYFEYRFASWRVATGANMVVAREMNDFHLSDFFPVFSWHNANILPRNMSAFVDATVAAAPGLEVYGQASFDDIRTTSFGIGDEPHPTISAFTAGSRYSVVARELSWDFGIDLGYTHYLWGNFPRDEGLARAIWRLRRAAPGYALALTSPYGPGTLFAIVSADVFAARFSKEA